jgi:NAD(P)-dependent dehydrogenase (short-subunit alcohol dehydrogenase family)
MALTDFTEVVAVITGGASGIGLATARTLHSRAAHIVLADINSSGLLQARDLISQQNKDAQGQIFTITTDVTNESQVTELMQKTIDRFGRIDLVVTSAGIGRGGAIDTFPASDMHMMMNINFMGTYHCVQASLPIMRKQESGHYVFLSSVAGKFGVPLLSGYCASKWAVRGFSSALRSELHGTGIGITTVYPAWVDTPMVKQEENSLNMMDIVVMLTPDQVASDILQAIINDQRDLTLAPNPDIAFILQIYKDDPEKAEKLLGEAYARRLYTSDEQTTI